jgi:hypothetical protein
MNAPALIDYQLSTNYLPIILLLVLIFVFFVSGLSVQMITLLIEAVMVELSEPLQLQWPI